MLFLSHNHFPEETPPRAEARVYMTDDHFTELDAAYLASQGCTVREYAAADPLGFFNLFFRGLNERVEAAGFIGNVEDRQLGMEATIDSREVGLAVAREYDRAGEIDPLFMRVDFGLRILPADAGPVLEMGDGVSPEALDRVLQASRTIIAFTLHPPDLA